MRKCLDSKVQELVLRTLTMRLHAFSNLHLNCKLELQQGYIWETSGTLLLG